MAIVASGQPLTPDAVRHSVAMLTGTGDESPAEVLTLDILSRRGKTIRPKTLNQKRYVDAIDAHTIVFGIGPAGTGKTYLAMAKAVNALQTKQVNRIILTRPAVEAGERLGFLPGTLSEKIDPYLRPLYDALHDMMDPELIPKLMSAGVIEVAPLAYMRGRAQPLFTKVLTPTASGRSATSRSATSSSARTGVRRKSWGSIRRASRRSTGSTPRTARRRLRPVTTSGRCTPATTGVAEAGAGAGDQGDDRQSPRGALSPLRVAASECTVSFESRAGATRSRTPSACCLAMDASHADHTELRHD